MPRIPTSLLALSLSCYLPAQIGPTAIPGEQMIEWPATIGFGPLRHAVGLYWETIDHMAAIALRDVGAGHAMAPAITPKVTPFDVGAPIVDCVTLPGAGWPEATPFGSQRRDALLLTVQGGDDLRLAHVDPGGAMVILPVTQPGWSQATAMTALTDGAGIEIAARSSTGTSVVRTRYNRTPGTFTPWPSIATTHPIRDLCLTDFDGDLLVDVAVLTDFELRVYNSFGVTLLSRPLPHPGGAIEAVPEPVGPNGLALLARDSSGTAWLLTRITLGNTEPARQVEIVVPDFSLVAMTAADFNGDGNTDLAIQDGGTKVRLVKNEGPSQPRFGSPNSLPLLTVGNLPGVQAPASARDYDYDGIADLLVPFTANGGQNFLVMKTGLSTHIQPSSTYGNIFTLESFHETPPGGGSFRLHVDTLGMQQSGFTHMRVKYYWATEDLQTGKTSDATFLFETMFVLSSLQSSGPFVQDVAGDHLHAPKLLFMVIQFLGSNNTSQKPTFLAGATINHLNPNGNPATSPFLMNNIATGTTKKDVKRTLTGGRKVIGIIVPQKSAPL